MAFRAGTTGALQTATNKATDLEIALIQNGVFEERFQQLEGDEVMEAIREDITANVEFFSKPLMEAVAADNKTYEEADKKFGGGSGSRNGSRPGGGGGGGKKQSPKDDNFKVVGGDYELTFGAFKGEAIKDIYEYDTSTAKEFGYNSGSGKKYVVDYLAKDKQKDSEYKSAREAYVNAKAFLADIEGI